MAGRPPKPTALKVLHGNPGKRRLNDREPKPPVGAKPPAVIRKDLTLLAEWNEHAPRLTRLGLLTEIDDRALAMVCILEVRLRDTLALADEAGAVLSTSAIIEISKELRMLWGRFGMTPADRVRVKTEKPSGLGGKLGRFIGGA